MSEQIAEIEGIGPVYAEKLATAGIKTTDDLLEQCCTPAGRQQLSKQTGLGDGFILKWANMADLMRVSGIGRQFAELLEAAGVDTIKELRQRNAENLAAKMQEVNDAKNLSGAAPPAATIADWIEKAKALEPKLTY